MQTWSESVSKRKYGSGFTTLLVSVNFTEFAHTTCYYTSDFFSKKYFNLLLCDWKVWALSARRKSPRYILLEGNLQGNCCKFQKFCTLKSVQIPQTCAKIIRLCIRLYPYAWKKTFETFNWNATWMFSGKKSYKFSFLKSSLLWTLPLLKCHICNFIRERFNELLSEI